MNDLIFCVATYEGGRTLRQALTSIEPYANQIVVIEGRFAEFINVHPTFRSRDDTLEIAHYFDAEVILHTNLSQCAARDLYLVGDEGDYYILWDDDWILDGSLYIDDLKEADVWAMWQHTPVPFTPEMIATGMAKQKWELANLIYKHKRGIHHLAGNLLADFNNNWLTNTNKDIIDKQTATIIHICTNLFEDVDYSKRTEFDKNTADLMRKAQQLGIQSKSTPESIIKKMGFGKDTFKGEQG